MKKWLFLLGYILTGCLLIYWGYGELHDKNYFIAIAEFIASCGMFRSAYVYYKFGIAKRRGGS